jgi:hypothetical protein
MLQEPMIALQSFIEMRELAMQLLHEQQLGHNLEKKVEPTGSFLPEQQSEII